jgi:glutamate--cysteine ligase
MPSPRRVLSVDQLRMHLRSNEFGVRDRDRVGAEVELTPWSIVDGRFEIRAAQERGDRLWADLSPPGPIRVASVSWRRGWLSREPGGQLEYSGPAESTPEAAARETSRAVHVLRARALRRDFELVAVGMHPIASTEAVGMHTVSRRYQALQSYLDRIGPYGRRCMRMTGSLQVNVDFGSPPELCERWELAIRLAPILTAAFANSAVEEGRPSLWRCQRGEAWLKFDPERTGVPPSFFEDPQSDPIAQYLRFALDAPVMFVTRTEGPYDIPSPSVSFRTWMAEGLPGGYPDLDDWQTHLKTLYPDVRPQGYLENRGVDAPGIAWIRVPILLVGHALRDAAVRFELLRQLRMHHDELLVLREQAARLGLADPTLRHLARVVFQAVRQRLSGPSEAMIGAYFERYVGPGRCPGDDLRDCIPDHQQLDPSDLPRLERQRVAMSSQSGAISTTGHRSPTGPT